MQQQKKIVSESILIICEGSDDGNNRSETMEQNEEHTNFLSSMNLKLLIKMQLQDAWKYFLHMIFFLLLSTQRLTY